MDGIIFCIILGLLGVNALLFPLGALGEFMWSFVNRTEVTSYACAWQDFKYDWFEPACDWGDEIFRWFFGDVAFGFIILFILAFLGSVGLLTWLVGIPLLMLIIMYGVRYFLDNFND